MNDANKKINATIITDFSDKGFPGLNRISLPSGMSINEGKNYYKNLSNIIYVEIYNI